MLRTATALAAFCLGLLGVAAATTAPHPAAPSGLTAAIAATAAARTPYAFDIDVNSSKINWRMHFGPRATPHLQLVSPPRASLSHDQQQAFDQSAQQLDDVSWCASPNMAHVSALQLAREDAATATYSFQPTVASIRNPQTRRFANQLRGEFTLNKTDPDIARVHLFAPAPFSPMLMTQITRIDVVVTCSPAPNGRMFAAQTVTQVAGSALGQAFSEQTVQRVHGLAAP
jgi:hypothetical protein